MFAAPPFRGRPTVGSVSLRNGGTPMDSLALALGRVLQSFLVQTSAHDPVTLVSIGVLLAVVSIAACLGPARRATRLDPLIALRHE